ncbi:MAG: metallophosphoesterase family protein [Clostridiales bacterium]|nr:metallophosphoesterase family protein [Clostridiales bacterium]
MKFAIISDIHGNAPSLRLALADAQQQGADAYLLAGDYCISAPWPNEVTDILRTLPNAVFVRGNDESHLDVPAGDDGQFEVSRWCSRTLTSENKAWLDALPEEAAFCCEGIPIRMAHASQAFVGKALQAHFRTSILPARYPHGAVSREALLADFRRTMAQDEACRAAIHALEPGVYIFGHNHIQAHGCFDGRWLIDPGSCGMPLDGGDFGACYSLLTLENNTVTVEERRVPYDLDTLIDQVKTTGQYASARVWSEIIFSEWRTCREKVFFFLTYTEEYANRIGDTRRPFAKDTWQAAHEEWTAVAPRRWPELFVR